MRILVTAGPTYEDIDDVRFIGNRSSGRMGFEVARAARSRGWDVTLITGPVNLETPPGVRRINVRSAREMFDACRRTFPQADAVVMTAAVADYTPAKKLTGKRKKSKRSWTLRLVPTPDILAWMGSHKRQGQLLVGFALEAGGVAGGKAEALRKLKAKNLDMIVLNGPESFNSEAATFSVLDASERWTDIGRKTKRSLAAWLAKKLEAEKSHR